MEHTQNIDGILALTDELNKLHTENAALRRIIREGQEPVRIKTFLKGLGAGVAITPAFLWLCWKLIELVIYAAGYIEVPPVLFGTLCVCIGTGLTLYLHSAAVCHGASRLLNVLMNSLLNEDDEKEGDK